MSKTSLSPEMREVPATYNSREKLQEVGPFVTISREYGCYGFTLGLLMVEILNESVPGNRYWQIYHKDILARLATETNMAQEMLDREMREKPSLIADFFRSFSQEHVPSGFEIRNRITTIIRGLAIQGHAIVIGQGGAAATADLPNGLSIRLEAPEEWRVTQVAFREGIDEAQARRKIREVESEREYIRKLFELRYPRKPAFHILYDCSAFTLSQIAQHVVAMMRLKGIR